MLAEQSLNGTVIRELVMEATQILRAAEIEEASSAANWFAESAFGMSRVERILNPDAEGDESACNIFRSMVVRRLAREPVQYITGNCAFMGLTMHVRPGVLIPRPETESVVEYALESISGLQTPRILDIGTGSGCIAIALAHVRPDAVVLASDVSPAALRIATENAKANSVNVEFIEADILSRSFPRQEPFDLIVSNPPYVPDSERASLEPEVVAHEPHEALFSGPDPQRFYRAIAAFGLERLSSGGILVVETHADHGPGTEEVLRAAGYSDVTLQRDLNGRWRIASGKYELAQPTSV